MNRFAEMMMRDGRNPYGSRGGYVTNRRPGRDRGMYDDYAYSSNDYAGYDSRRGGGSYSGRDYARGGRDYERGGEYRDYYGGYPMMDYYSDEYDYAHGAGRRGSRDYGEEGMGRFSKRDMEKWKREMKNDDGSMGEHFQKEQVEQAARQAGINIDEIGKDIFCLGMNMMYSDYCRVAQKYGVDRPDYYAELAKAFLKDKDFDGEPEEKLWLYYKCIVEKD